MKMDQILSKINGTTSMRNMDMKAMFAGRLHHDKGFKIKIQFAENVSDSLVAQWKRICSRYGYDAQVFMRPGVVQIVCMRQTTAFRAHHLYFLCGAICGILLVYRRGWIL